MTTICVILCTDSQTKTLLVFPEATAMSTIQAIASCMASTMSVRFLQ